MNPFELLSKPLNLNFKSLQPAPESKYKSPLPSINPKLSLLSTPLPTAVKELVKPKSTQPPVISGQNMTMLPITPFKVATRPIPTPILETVRKTVEKQPEYTVRKQDWRDIGNLPSELVINPILSGLMSLNEVRTGKPSGKVNVPFPHYQTVTDGDYTRQVPIESPAVGSRRFYNDLVAKGVEPDDAYNAAIVKTIGDMSVLVPIFRDTAKLTALKTAPQSLIKAEIENTASQTVTKQQMRDYLAGRATDFEMPQALRESIAQVLKTGSKEDKRAILNGIVGTQTLSVQPSRLGRILGVSQGEADALLTELYGGRVRQAPTGALPGYREIEGQPAPMGLSIRKMEKVGGKTPPKPAISKELQPLAQEARKYKSAEEFVKAVRFHGTTPENAALIKSSGFKGEASFTSDQSEALQYTTGEGIDDFGDIRKEGLISALPKKEAKNIGKDGIDKLTGEDIFKPQDVIVIPDNVNLTNIWNQANGKTEIARKGGEFEATLPKEEAKKIMRTMFEDKELDLFFDPKLIEKRGATGIFDIWDKSPGQILSSRNIRPMITLLEQNGKVDERVLYHEAFHGHFNTRLTAKERNAAIEKVRKSLLTKAYKLKTEYKTEYEKAEEWLADDFADYVRTGKSKGGFEGLWEKLLRAVRDFIRRTKGFKKIYDDILKGPKGKKIPEKLKPVSRAKKTPDERLGNWKEEANQELTSAEEQLALKAKAIRDIKNRGLSSEQERVELLKLEREFAEEALADMPGKKLQKYVSKTTGRLPEVTGKPTRMTLKGGKKIVKNSLWGQKGDDIAQNMLGFKSLEEAQDAYSKYVAQRKRVESIQKKLSEAVIDFTSKKAILQEVRKAIAVETEGRINKIRAIQKFFQLSDQDLSKLMGFKGMRNISMMTEKDFQNFLKKMEGLASANFILEQERMKVNTTIFEKELVKVDNLRQALKLPEIKNMSLSQLQDFGALLETFEQGDEFLGVRQLQTVKNTKLGEIKTVREARKKFMEESGATPEQVGRIIDRGAREFDDIRAASLPDVSPFHKLTYEEMIRVFLDRDKKLLDLENKLFPLIKRARKSRARGVVGRLVPTDQKIWDWLNAPSAEKIVVSNDPKFKMTAEELMAGQFMQDQLAEMRDYLLSNQTLKGTRFYNNYISHIQRDFLESVKEDGLMAAWKEMKLRRELVEANFEILAGKESDVLPLEKFFRYSQRRPEGLVPSKNVPRVFMQYAKAFYTKQALDEIVPKLVIYAHTLTPKRATPRGLEYNDSLKRWLNAYINSQKGRPPAILRNLIKPGNRVDWALKTGVAFTRLLDLGINLPVQIASPIGEQMAMLPGLRERQVVGLTRLATPKGRAISKKYKNFIGKTLWETISDPTTNITDKLQSSIFAGFGAGSRKASQVWLLGSMTKDEWSKGAISPQRLSQMKARMSKYRAIEKSILGTTSLGQVATQYRSWAIPIFSRNISNITKLVKMVRKDGIKKARQSEEFTDLFASTITTAAIALAVYSIYAQLEDEKDRTLLEDIAFKSARESMTIIGAMDPTVYTSSPRVLSFLYDLSSALKTTLQGERYKTGENRRELKGKVKFQETITPRAFKSISSMFEGRKSRPGTNSLSGIKLIPKSSLQNLNLKNKSDLSSIKLVPRKIQLTP